MSKGKVLVTGASGYIAGFVVQSLLAENWTVRGTVRDLAKADAVRAALGVTPDQLELVAADLTADAGWDAAAAGCDYVQHIASPLLARIPKSADDLVIPARDGALRVLQAARDAGVKRVVLTSSVSAICYGKTGPGKVFTEADWTDLATVEPYSYNASKTIAERAARDWIAAEGGGLELVTINPGMVFGPVLGGDFSASLIVLTKLLDGALPGCPRLGFAIVDVRDIAAAHLAVMTAPGMANERFLCAGKLMWMRDIADVLRIRLGNKAKRVPARNLPDWLVRIVARFDPDIRMVLPELGRERICDASHAKAVLGWVPRPAEETIVDAARSLIAHGLVKA